MRSSSSGSPAMAVARNQARPPPASRRVVASPNRLLPLRVPPSARISGVATSGSESRDDQARDERQLDLRTHPVTVEPATQRNDDRAGDRPDEERADRPDHHDRTAD